MSSARQASSGSSTALSLAEPLPWKMLRPQGGKVFPGEQPRTKGAIRSKISLTSPTTPLASPNSRSRRRRTRKKGGKKRPFSNREMRGSPISPLVSPSHAARSSLLLAWKLLDCEMGSHGVQESSYLLTSPASKPLHSLAARRRVFRLTTAGWPFLLHRQNGLQPPRFKKPWILLFVGHYSLDLGDRAV